ncbi:sugar ABC transporter ATP-binding protein [Azospirillum sp. SYSU D00513]|uniref:sugar ABC transporter ATP-binding protein n=1 Tax=Azospirillum sp. SYSU D00513 TaxID=2812561 RepID=UPI001A96C316|nr:sugar ABC transporter ATP-binding protein [Azospirillum sp. SYSU D00513]
MEPDIVPAPRGAPRRPAAPVLVAEGLSKQFPGVKALDRVSFDLRAGEVHALCGENGAGKSTLMKILTGVYQPDEGRILYKGEEQRFRTVLDAPRMGIAIIHQELNLVPHLTVAENIFLGREPKRGPFVDRKRMTREAAALLKRLAVDIAPGCLVKSLPVARQQMVEIAKALSLNAEVLIMDEPTSSLTESETDQLFQIIRELKRDGVGIVYVSHRLDELKHIVDRVTVLRDGAHVWTKDFQQTSVAEIVNAMVGRSLSSVFPQRSSRPTAEVILKVEGLSRRGVFEDVGFELRRGEILGFAGLMGAGRTEVARAVFGADARSAGTITLHGREIRVSSPIDAIAQGIAYLSEDRKHDGLAVTMSVMENLTITDIPAVTDRFGFLRPGRERAVAEEYVRLLNIRTPSIHKTVKNLSGGNQQKIVIGKWLFRKSKVLFFDEPTRGIDVGAKFAIYELLDRLAAEGIGVVLISSELPEILGVTDRVVVFREGRVTGLLETRATSQEEIMEYASGLPGAGSRPTQTLAVTL